MCSFGGCHPFQQVICFCKEETHTPPEISDHCSTLSVLLSVSLCLLPCLSFPPLCLFFSLSVSISLSRTASRQRHAEQFTTHLLDAVFDQVKWSGKNNQQMEPMIDLFPSQKYAEQTQMSLEKTVSNAIKDQQQFHARLTCLSCQSPTSPGCFQCCAVMRCDASSPEAIVSMFDMILARSSLNTNMNCVKLSC